MTYLPLLCLLFNRGIWDYNLSFFKGGVDPNRRFYWRLKFFLNDRALYIEECYNAEMIKRGSKYFFNGDFFSQLQDLMEFLETQGYFDVNNANHRYS